MTTALKRLSSLDDLAKRFGVHIPLVDALAQGGPENAMAAVVDEVQCALVFGATGRVEISIKLLSEIAEDPNARDRDHAAFLSWVGLWDNAVVSLEDVKGAIQRIREASIASVDRFSSTLDQEIARYADAVDDSLQRDSLVLCRGMLFFQRPPSRDATRQYLRDFKSVAKKSRSNYLRGRAEAMLGAHYLSRSNPGNVGRALTDAIIVANQLLFRPDFQRHGDAEFDSDIIYGAVSSVDMTDVNGAATADDVTSLDWVSVRRALATLPEEHIDEAVTVVETRRQEVERQMKFHFVVEMARALFPDLSGKRQVTDQDLTDQFEKASKRDASEFKGEQKKQRYVDLVRAFRAAGGTVELDGVEVRVGFVKPKGFDERTFETQLTVKGRKGTKAFWVPPPLEFRMRIPS